MLEQENSLLMVLLLTTILPVVLIHLLLLLLLCPLIPMTKSGAPLTILEKMKFLKSAEEYGSGAGGGSEESVAYVSNIARCVKEKLEIARKQFDESYGSSDRIIPNDVKEEAVYPMAAERIISGSNDFKSCSQDMDES